MTTVAANGNATAATADDAAKKRMRLTRVKTAAVVKNKVPHVRAQVPLFFSPNPAFGRLWPLCRGVKGAGWASRSDAPRP